MTKRFERPRGPTGTAMRLEFGDGLVSPAREPNPRGPS